jgi:hypothetical protein
MRGSARITSVKGLGTNGHVEDVDGKIVCELDVVRHAGSRSGLASNCQAPVGIAQVSNSWCKTASISELQAVRSLALDLESNSANYSDYVLNTDTPI